MMMCSRLTSKVLGWRDAHTMWLMHACCCMPNIQLKEHCKILLHTVDIVMVALVVAMVQKIEAKLWWPLVLANHLQLCKYHQHQDWKNGKIFIFSTHSLDLILYQHLKETVLKNLPVSYGRYVILLESLPSFRSPKASCQRYQVLGKIPQTK